MVKCGVERRNKTIKKYQKVCIKHAMPLMNLDKTKIEFYWVNHFEFILPIYVKLPFRFPKMQAFLEGDRTLTAVLWVDRRSLKGAYDTKLQIDKSFWIFQN